MGKIKSPPFFLRSLPLPFNLLTWFLHLAYLNVIFLSRKKRQDLITIMEGWEAKLNLQK